MPFRLRAELQRHGEDVRGVAFCAERRELVSASRDRTLKVWSVPAAGDGSSHFACERTLEGGHTKAITCVHWIPPKTCEGFPDGVIVSGGMDFRVVLWSGGDGDTAPKLTLQGHEQVITKVTHDARGRVVSASQDKTLRVWEGGTCAAVLAGHESSVLCATVLSSGALVSGSADTTLKLWTSEGICSNTLRGHNDSVRAVAELANVGIVSASHDTTIKVWTLDGSPLMELLGHTSLIFGLCTTPGGLIVSGGEDNFLRVWADGQCVQAVEHPCVIWDLCTLDSGDIVCACSDSSVRIWTQEDALALGDEAQAAFAESVRLRKEASKKQSNGGASDTGVKLEPMSALLKPGDKDGAYKFIEEEDGGWAYQWSSAQGEWVKIGQITEGPEDGNGSGGNTINGVRYDRVVPVEMDDGVARKIGWNNGDNPYDVADKWLADNGMPDYFREQIVQFVIANSAESSGGLFSRADADAQNNADPLSGRRHQTNLYIPQSAPVKVELLPQMDGLRRKLSEFNAEQGTLQEDELSLIDTLLDQLRDIKAIASQKISAPEVEILTKLLVWPADRLFPIVDTIRLLLLSEATAGVVARSGELLSALGASLHRTLQPPYAKPALFTSLSLLANCFWSRALDNWLLAVREEVLGGLVGVASFDNKHVRIGLSIVALNYAILSTTKADGDAKRQTLSLSAGVLSSDGVLEPDAAFNLLLAVGTLVFEDRALKDLARDLGVPGIIAQYETSPTEKLASCCREIEAAMR